jgi:hypothetical protein
MKTINGYEVSLTEFHNIPVFDPKNNQIQFFPASKVQLTHRLIMYGEIVPIENISSSNLIGFNAPLTRSGYLMVNNISTSVFPNKYFLFVIFL